MKQHSQIRRGAEAGALPHCSPSELGRGRALKDPAPGPVNSSPRAALYAEPDRGYGGRPGSGASLLECARHARQREFRVVAMAQGGVSKRIRGVGGSRLLGLVDRMALGEFDVIVAKIATGHVLTITGAARRFAHRSVQHLAPRS